MKPGEKVPEHLRQLDDIRAYVDKLTPEQRCAFAGYHLVIEGKCACGYIEMEDERVPKERTTA